MTLTFKPIIYDESGLPDSDSDTAPNLDSNVASLSTALSTLISANTVSSQYYTGANAVTQYAELTNFITDPNAGPTNYVLASDTSGDAFSTSGAGVATGLYVGANEIFLYGTSDPNVVVGRIGSGTTGSSSGDIAMIIALSETKDGSGHVTATDLGIEMFAPLTNSDGAHVDDADTASMLNGALFIYETHSTVSIVPFNNFNGVPSGQDAYALIGPSDNSSGVDLLTTGFAGTTAGTVNVSTTGLGANSQAVDNGSSLRIDIVNANATDFANQMGSPPGAHSDVNLSYQNHVQAIEASFELTQNNPTGKAASLTVSAYEDSNNLQGHSFTTDALSSEGTLVHIATSNVIIRDNAGNDITSTFKTGGGTITQSGDGNSVLITGLTATEHVDFIADSQFDRFVITNTQTGPNDKVTFDVGDIRVSTITGGSGHDSGDLGPSLTFEDGGPSVTVQADANAAITVDESTLGSLGKGSADYSGLFNINYGPDGQGATPVDYALAVKSSGVDSGLKDTATGHEIFLYADGSSVVGRVGSSTTTPDSGGAIDFRISVDSSGNVTFEQDHSVLHSGTTVSDEPLTMSTADLVTLTATAHDGDGDSASSPAANIATTFTILDDEPHSLGTGSSITVGNNLSSSPPSPELADTGSGSFTTYNAGNDGVGSFTITGSDTSGDYTWVYGSGGTDQSTIIESYKGSQLFSLALDSSTGGYTMTMLGTLPYSQLNLDANNIKAGGPTGSIDVGTLNDGGDYVQITGTVNNTGGQLNGTAGGVNASNGNVGVVNGNLDGGEALSFSLFTPANVLVPVYGLDMGTKTAQGASYHLYGILDSDHSTVVDLGTQSLAKGGTIHYAGNVLLDSIIVEETAGNAVKIGLAGVHLLLPPADAGFHFTAQLADGDGDTVSSSFNVYIDGNNDGTVDTAHVLFPV
jgi:hypothetical protein